MKPQGWWFTAWPGLILAALFVTRVGSVGEHATWSAGPLKRGYAEDGVVEDYLPGTCYFTGHVIPGRHGSGPWEPGDRLALRCELDRSADHRAPCDSFTLHVTLGQRELPVGIEWPLLSLRWGCNLDYPVSNRREVLDERFTKCGVDSIGIYYTRLVVVAADTSSRVHPGPRLARLRKAVDAFRANPTRRDKALPWIQAALDDDRSDPLLNILLAGALADAGQCWEYGLQSARLTELGFGCPGMTAEIQSKNCLKWQPGPGNR